VLLSHLAPDITLSTLSLVSPRYTLLHPSVTFLFWTLISLSALYYKSPHNIQYFTPMLPSTFDLRYHSQHPIMSLQTIYSFSPLCYLHIWPQISLSAPYYESPHNIQFFTPVLPSNFGHRYHSHHPIMRLPTICSSSPLSYLPLLAPDITLSTLISVSQQYTFFHPCVTFAFRPRNHSQHPIISLPTIYSFSPLCYLPLMAPEITLSTKL